MVHGESHGERSTAENSSTELVLQQSFVLSRQRLISVLLFQLLFGTWSPFRCNSPPCNSEILATYISPKWAWIKQAGCCFLCSITHFKPWLVDSRQWVLAGRSALQWTTHRYKCWAVEGYGPVCCFWAMQATWHSVREGVLAAQRKLFSKSGQDKCKAHEKAQDCNQNSRLGHTVTFQKSPKPPFPSTDLSMNLAPLWTRLPIL